LDSSLHFLTLKDLKSSLLSPLKNAPCLGIDSDIHSPINFCIGAKKAITVFSLDSSLNLSKKIHMEENITVENYNCILTQIES
jgi:hypothetical protein